MGDRLDVETNKGLVSNAKVTGSYPWKDIEKVCAEWYCFSGTVAVKLRNGEQHHFSMPRNKLMNTASAIHRRIGRSKSATPCKPIDEKVRKLLHNHKNVGLSGDGLMMKRRTGCCTSGIVLSPWNSFVSIRLARGCCHGNVTVHTVMKPHHRKKPKEIWSTNGGFRDGGENLLSDDDEDDMEFIEDRVQDMFTITTSASMSEQLYGVLKARMSGDFGDMEELHGVYPIKSRKVMGKLTAAGIHASMFSVCAKEAKVFTPWDNIISVAYKYPTCFRQSCVVVEDRSSISILLKDVSFKSFQDIERTFSKKSKEDAEFKTSQKALENIGTSASKGLEVLEDGIHYDQSHCCRRRIRTFIPWSKLDGLRLTTSSLGRTTMELVTETGDSFRVAKTTKRKAWLEFDNLHKAKYGVDAPENVKIFNQMKDERYSCKLSDQSLFLSLNKGANAIEVDLDRVIGARRSRKTHTQLDVGVSMGRLSDVIRVPLLKGYNGRELAREIRAQTEKRKSRMLKEAAGIAILM